MAWCNHEEPRRSCRKCNPELEAKDRRLALQKGTRPSTLVMKVGDSPPQKIEDLLREEQRKQRLQRARDLDQLAAILPAIVYITDFGRALHVSRACLEEAQRRGVEKGLGRGEIKVRSPLSALRNNKRPCLNCLPQDSVDGLSDEMKNLWDTLIREIPPDQGLLFN